MNKITPAQITLEPIKTWLTVYFNHPNLHGNEGSLQNTLQNTTALLYSKSFNANWSEQKQVDWLIDFFNTLYKSQQVVLAHSSSHEPEYLPATNETPAKIFFAHGFFASALHEISHWCIAGKHRRTLPDFGYWYEPDGRNHVQQLKFEQVEVKPQAIECLLTLMLQKNFLISIDNLNSPTIHHHSNFSVKVYNQVLRFIANPMTLPKDAKVLLYYLSLLSLSTD